jgi:hypothetical protein
MKFPLFSRLMTLFSKSKNEAPEEKAEEESIAEEDRLCQISYTCDKDGIVWIDINWKPNRHSEFADLLYMVSSGQMLSETLEFIEGEALPEEYEYIIKAVLDSSTEKMKDVKSDFQKIMSLFSGDEDQTEQDNEVVSPSDLFNAIKGQLSDKKR